MAFARSHVPEVWLDGGLSNGAPSAWSPTSPDHDTYAATHYTDESQTYTRTIPTQEVLDIGEECTFHPGETRGLRVGRHRDSHWQ